MSKFIRMVAKLLYRYLESVLLKFIPTVPTKELSQHFMSLMLQHCVFSANLRLSYFVLTVLQPTGYEQISTLTNSNFKYRLSGLLYKYKDIFEGTGARGESAVTCKMERFLI